MKNQIRYFVEVKYRSSNLQGGAIASITPKKLAQMRFAAELYNTRHQTANSSQLMVVTIHKDGDVRALKVE